MKLFDRLKASCSSEWEAYTQHEFVKRIGDGTLAKESFQHYLKQDYLFLIQFARCFALAAYQSHNLDDMKRAQANLGTIINLELDLHLKYCAKWGIERSTLDSLAASPANKAYTDYVMAKGMEGGLLELYVALSPCSVGYGEIGRRLNESPDTIRQDNPYLDWIEMYSGNDYLKSVDDMIAYLDQLMGAHADAGQEDELKAIFKNATYLEINFWQMGLDLT